VSEGAEVGVATGLAWTSTGGEILPIEVTLLSGKGELILTGHLGEVMKESARAALSWVRAAVKRLGIKAEVFDRSDIHLHVPEGAIPKDGPSAGVAIAVAIASAASGIAVDRRVAMTGEITLRGRVLPIGGLNEKAVAALRTGVRTLLVPHDNAKDLHELPAFVRAALDIVLVRDMSEVLARTLEDGKPAAARPRSRTRARTRTRPRSRPGLGRTPIGATH
jgi:ATP-dependent Lon protease